MIRTILANRYSLGSLANFAKFVPVPEALMLKAASRIEKGKLATTSNEIQKQTNGKPPILL